MTDVRPPSTARRAWLLAGGAAIVGLGLLVALLLRWGDDDPREEAGADEPRVLTAGGSLLGPVAAEGNHQIRIDLERYACSGALLFGGPDPASIDGLLDTSGCAESDILIFDDKVALDRFVTDEERCADWHHAVRGDVWLVLTSSESRATRLHRDGGGRLIDCAAGDSALSP